MPEQEDPDDRRRNQQRPLPNRVEMRAHLPEPLAEPLGDFLLPYAA